MIDDQELARLHAIEVAAQELITSVQRDCYNPGLFCPRARTEKPWLKHEASTICETGMRSLRKALKIEV